LRNADRERTGRERVSVGDGLRCGQCTRRQQSAVAGVGNRVMRCGSRRGDRAVSNRVDGDLSTVRRPSSRRTNTGKVDAGSVPKRVGRCGLRVGRRLETADVDAVGLGIQNR